MTGRRPPASGADQYGLLVRGLAGGMAVVLAVVLAIVGATALIVS